MNKLLLVLGFIFLSLFAGVANAFTGGDILGTCEQVECTGATTGPLPSYPIGIFDSGGNVLLASTVCDESGIFVFADVPPGSYVVKSEIVPRFQAAVSIPNTGGVVSGVTLIDTAIVKGTALVDEDCDTFGDAPHPGCTIELCDTSNPTSPCETAITSATGEYEFPCVPPGTYTVRQTDCLGGYDASGGDPDVGTVIVPGGVSMVNGIDFTDYDLDWWCTVVNNYNGIGQLRKCMNKQPDPFNPNINGDGCSPQASTCYFGTRPACPFGPSPETRCFCDGMFIINGINGNPGIPNPTQTWDCQPYPCPTSATHVYN